MLRGAEKVWIVPNPRGERHPAIVILIPVTARPSVDVAIRGA